MRNITYIDVPPVDFTDTDKLNFCIELCFNKLITTALEKGIITVPPAGLMYLPKQETTVQFQEACKAVLELLKEN